jgi:hypothetical protein
MPLLHQRLDYEIDKVFREVYMAGEFKIADKVVAKAIAEAEMCAGMTEEGMLTALLNSVLAKLVATKPKDELLSQLDFLIDSQSQGSIVVTRGC